MESTKLDYVRDQADVGFRREDEFVLGVELLEDVVLERAAQPRPIDAAVLGVGEKKRQDDDGGRVDRHGHRHFAEIDSVEQLGHIVEDAHGDAEPANLTEGASVVGVEAHEGGQVKSGAEAGLALGEQEAEALVGLSRRTEAGELAHGPEPAAVHRSMDAAREGILSRITKIGFGVEAAEAVGRIKRVNGDAANGGGRLLARRGAGVFALPAVVGGCVGDGGHVRSSTQ